MKKTKIVCTLGPACQNESVLEQMIKNGMNVARINMSHGTHDSLQTLINTVKSLREKLELPISLIADTKGPEIRFGEFKKDGVVLKAGQLFTLTSKKLLGSESIATISYPPLIKEVNIGDKIYANNGMLVLKVKEKKDNEVLCKVLFGGKLTSKKGLNIPTINIRSNFISQTDREDLLFAIKNDVEFIAASFVSSKSNVLELRNFLDENGGKNIRIISKIENAQGIKNIDEICSLSSGIMVARGDLGVEIPLEKIPSIQKTIISKCNKLGLISIVATEMLESMTTSIRPTRAEVSDVANAIYEKATATMLSGETAIGKHPALVVKTMTKIILEAEKNILYTNDFIKSLYKPLSISDSIAESTCKNAINLNAKTIVVFTNSGITAGLLSRYRTPVRIIALTPNKYVYRGLSLNWNTTPFFVKNFSSEESMLEYSKELCKKLSFAKENDILLVVTGTPKVTGSTNMTKIIRL